MKTNKSTQQAIKEDEIQSGTNTDRELYREPTNEGGGFEYYMPYVYVTKSGGIGMCAGGKCSVRPIKEWISFIWNESSKLQDAEQKIREDERRKTAEALIKDIKKYEFIGGVGMITSEWEEIKAKYDTPPKESRKEEGE